MKPVITPLTILLLTISISIADARILNVPEAFQTIQAGIDSSQNGDTVLVQPGEYHEGAHVNNRSIVIASAYIFDASDETIAATIINGDNRRIGVSLIWFGEGKQATVSGFTITNGWPLGTYVLESTVRVTHCRFINNQGDHDPGGAINSQGGSIEIDNCTFIGNRDPVWGGGVGVSGASDVIRSCLFVNNAVGYYGGALVILSDVCEVTRCTFVDNIAGHYGSAILVMGESQARISNSVFKNNHSSFIATDSFEGHDRNNQVWIDWCDTEDGVDSVLINGDDTLLWGDNNLDADPLFLDPDNGDYRLSANSPCIDAGDPEAPLDPDGTRVDIGAYYFHQRDIGVAPREIVFEALAFGESDSQLVIVSNIGETDLTIRVRQEVERSAITMAEAGGNSIVIPARQGLQLWAIYTAQEQAQENQHFVIGSNDPDEPEVTIEASVFENSVPSDTPQPAIFNLQSAYPNPFNGQTTIRFSVGLESHLTRLAVYGVDGRMMKELWTGMDVYSHREHSVIWKAERVPAGVYIVRLEAGEESRMMKVVLVR